MKSRHARRFIGKMTLMKRISFVHRDVPTIRRLYELLESVPASEDNENKNEYPLNQNIFYNPNSIEIKEKRWIRMQKKMLVY